MTSVVGSGMTTVGSIRSKAATLFALGDWIITGVQGERYPCKPDIFEATYEPVKRFVVA